MQLTNKQHGDDTRRSNSDDDFPLATNNSRRLCTDDIDKNNDANHERPQDGNKITQSTFFYY